MRNRNVIASTLLISATISGCAADKRMDYKFIVVDQSSGQPVDGVSVEIWGSGHYHNNRLFPGEEKFVAPPTSSDGRIVAPQLIQEHFTYYITFRKPSYRTVQLINSITVGPSKWALYYGESDSDNARDLQGKVTLRSDSENVMAMPRVNTSGAQP